MYPIATFAGWRSFPGVVEAIQRDGDRPRAFLVACYVHQALLQSNFAPSNRRDLSDVIGAHWHDNMFSFSDGGALPMVADTDVIYWLERIMYAQRLMDMAKMDLRPYVDANHRLVSADDLAHHLADRHHYKAAGNVHKIRHETPTWLINVNGSQAPHFVPAGHDEILEILTTREAFYLEQLDDPDGPVGHNVQLFSIMLEGPNGQTDVVRLFGHSVNGTIERARQHAAGQWEENHRQINCTAYGLGWVEFSIKHWRHSPDFGARTDDEGGPQ